MKARKLFWLPAVMLMAACGNEEESSLVSSMPIQFSAEISASRVTGDSWNIGDRIGISMTGDGSEKTNLPYVTVQTDGKFSAEGEELRFPDEPKEVNFYAYYPYSETLSGDILTFNVDGKTDVLWAQKTVSAEEQTAAAVSLEFSHKLSKVLVRTTGFADDVAVALKGSCYSQGTLNIKDGTVDGAGEQEETSFSLLATSKPGEFYAIFVPETENANKTLVLTSESEDREWEYDLQSFAFEGGKQYIYDIDRSNAGIVFTNKIIPWISSDPDDLKNPIGGPIPLTIKRYLNGKTFKPDINYFFDSLGETGTNGYTNNGGNGFGNNVTENGQWTQDLKDKCESSSIKFYYGEDGQLMADAVNDGVAISGIIVTVDEKNKTLAFSREPFDYHWVFNDKVSWGRDDYWLLFAQNDAPQWGSFTMNTAVNEIEKLFVGDKIHLAFYSTKDKTYYVANFVKE